MTVTTWGEFIAALQTSGAVIDLPGGLWECNSMIPEGFQEQITIAAAQVNGNGTILHNLYGDLLAGNHSCTFSNMQILNCVSQKHVNGTFEDCIITGMLQCGIGGLRRCSVNIKSETATAVGARADCFSVSGINSRIKLNLPVIQRLDDNAQASTGNTSFIAQHLVNCELIIDAPNAVGKIRPMYWENTIMRGNCPGITQVIQYYDWEVPKVSYVSKACCPNAQEVFGPQFNPTLHLTDEVYLNNAAWMIASGFPIEEAV